MSNIIIIPLGIGATPIDKTNLIDYPKVEAVVVDFASTSRLSELVEVATHEHLMNPQLVLDSVITSFIGVIDNRGLLHTLADADANVLDKAGILDYISARKSIQLTIVLNSLQAIADTATLSEANLNKIYDAAIKYLDQIGALPVNTFFVELKEILG